MAMNAETTRLPPLSSMGERIPRARASRCAEAILAKKVRDETVGGARGDIQNKRRFFSDADWPAVVELSRKGMPAAAALSALGYSTPQMRSQVRGQGRPLRRDRHLLLALLQRLAQARARLQ
jgi:hypothetical protein